MSKYQYVPYDPIYPKLYLNEKNRIIKKLAKNTIIEHIGSTAVPKLGGKGIIDIYIAVPKGHIKETCNQLVKLGYSEPKIDAENDPNRLYTKRTSRVGNIERRYQIHLCEIGYKDFVKCIAFRDYLISHPKEAKEYDEIKKLAVKEADKYENDSEKRSAYMKVKEVIIKRILDKIAE